MSTTHLNPMIGINAHSFPDIEQGPVRF